MMYLLQHYLPLTMTGQEIKMCNLAAENNQLGMQQYLHSLGWRGDNQGIRVAIAKGYLDLVVWIHEQGPRWTESWIMQMVWAAQNGHLELLQFLQHHHTNEFLTHEWDIDIVAANGHLPVLQHLQQSACPSCTTTAMDLAASYGHLEVVI
ncbi:Aste57867_20166 [Aphanomyces stellatus]|uniref:Aste57867_20166 protein n=1 Tax=Aphanomyces stellatus TaxID=120398 RepID=A0A485LF25_9STRA|nr:hypothetical protein As57867_020100 [Aphanomyces stellatus]VFT96861.1 Aste57867_20166 [Aphanomyces stellatus]